MSASDWLQISDLAGRRITVGCSYLPLQLPEEGSNAGMVHGQALQR